MRSFLTRHERDVKGVLSGLDRIRFRGTIRWLSSCDGMMSFLGTIRVLLKDFKDWSMALTDSIKRCTAQIAETAGRQVIYLHSSEVRKEHFALNIAAATGISEGLICVLTCVEPCFSFKVGPNRSLQKLELRYGPSKCLHHYFYWLHPQFGLTHLRLQTWLPWTVHVCLNGREWLARQLAAEQISYEQRDNCLVDVADIPRAQALLDRQLRTNWAALLDGLMHQVPRAHATLLPAGPLNYYWSAEETEYATDVMFRSRESLAKVYPRLVRHAITTFSSGDVLRFLGRSVRAMKKGEISSTLKTRPEGVRVKHEVNGNSVKMYDKQETVLRVETTINHPRDLKSLRHKEGEDSGPKRWRTLRKGVADLHARAQISQKANERYLDGLAQTDQPTTLAEIVQPLCQPVKWHGRRARGLRPLETDDSALLIAIARGEFTINGFRNRDLRPLLFGNESASQATVRRQSAKITRLIRVLRAHRLVQKLPRSHRYQLTGRGRETVTALITAQNASVQRLTQLAA